MIQSDDLGNENRFILGLFSNEKSTQGVTDNPFLDGPRYAADNGQVSFGFGRSKYNPSSGSYDESLYQGENGMWVKEGVCESVPYFVVQLRQTVPLWKKNTSIISMEWMSKQALT